MVHLEKVFNTAHAALYFFRSCITDLVCWWTRAILNKRIFLSYLLWLHLHVWWTKLGQAICPLTRVKGHIAWPSFVHHTCKWSEWRYERKMRLLSIARVHQQTEAVIQLQQSYCYEINFVFCQFFVNYLKSNSLSFSAISPKPRHESHVKVNLRHFEPKSAEKQKETT